MRILLVNDLAISDPERSGAEVYLDRLAGALSRAGHEIDLFAGEVRHAGAGRVLDLWDPRARSRLVSRVQATRPDVVHFHNVVRELSVAALLVPAPRVLTAHDMRLAGTVDPRTGSIRGIIDRQLKRRLDATVARRALDEVVAVSEPVAESLRAAGFLRVTTMSPPAPIPIRSPRSPDDCSDLAYAGRLSQDKGIFVLLQAWRLISERHPTSRLLVAGDGPLRDDLSQVGDESVHFVGRLDSDGVSRLLGSVRAVVVPSLPRLRPEGSPLSVVDAAAHGRPVIASDDPGIAALAAVLPGCVLSPAGDVRALAAHLDQLLNEPAHAARLGKANAEASRLEHAPEHLAARMEQVYQRAIEARRPRVRTREVAYSG
ncbi:MAG TPA: glycosyltransferase family 4 protein [Frankiaceae bacterium]|nr:glycosyltransferase family 4 protein [Frankiaceae bacterium]